MAIGVQNSSGTDFDSLFERRQSGDPLISSNTNVQAQGGTELRNLYCPASMGSLISSNTGVQSSAGTDCRSLFAALGSVVRWDGTLADLASSYSESGNGQNQALVEIIFDTNGNIRLRGNYPFRENVIGSWDGSKANSSNTQIRFVVTSGSLSSNGATSFVTMSSLRALSVSAFNSTQSASVRVELQQAGNSSTRETKTISLYASHTDGNIGGPVRP